MPVPITPSDYDYGVDATLIDLTCVKTTRDLSTCLNVRYSTLVYFANVGRNSHYTTFQLRKRSGATRLIEAPVDVLKHVQRQLADALAAIYIAPKAVHGFVSGRSIVSNAESHAGKRWVLNLDLKDFFPSINFGRVRGVLIGRPYGLPAQVATVIARLCCHRDRLPQGAPSSPVLANMVARGLDTKLRELARRHHISYSRYADDITFSGHSRSIPASLATYETGSYRCSETLRSLIKACGFATNDEKFRVQFGGMRKVVTGLVVNEHVNVRRRYVRGIRAMLHAWRKFGYDGASHDYERLHWTAATPRKRPLPSFRRVVRGKLEYLRHIKGETDLVFGLFKQLAVLDTAPSLQRVVTDMERRRATILGRLQRAVFVLESDDSQGTGFLTGVGLVTCAHVIESNVKAFLPDDPDKKYSVIVKHRDAHRDVAVLEIDGLSPRPDDHLPIASGARLNLSADVILAGFANYAGGASLSVKTAQVSQRRRWFDHSRYTVNTGIIAGMSGGPVLTIDGAVIGIAVSGASTNARFDDPEAQHGVIPWVELAASLESTSKER